MRWCVGLLLAGCTARALFVPEGSPAIPSDLAGRDAVIGYDLSPKDVDIDAGSIDLALPSDLAPLPDAGSTLTWVAVPLPDDEEVLDVSGWSGAVVVATRKLAGSYPSQHWMHGTVRSYDGSSWTTLIEAELGDADEGGFSRVLALSASEIYAVVPHYMRKDHTSKILLYDGTSWSESLVGYGDGYDHLGTLGSGEVIATGEDVFARTGLVALKGAGGWTRLTTAYAVDLQTAWGASSSDFYVGGYQKAFIHYDGTFTDLSLPTGTGRYFAMWAGSDGDVIFGGLGLHRYDGSSITTVPGVDEFFFDACGITADRAYFVGAKPPLSYTGAVIYLYEGGTWTPQPVPPEPVAYRLFARGDDDLWLLAGEKLYHGTR